MIQQWLIASYPAPASWPPTSWLTHFWNLNGNSTDSVGGSNGTNTAVTFPSETLGTNTQVASFGGSGWIATNVTGHNSGDFTISCWVNFAWTGDQCLWWSSSGNWWGLRYWNPAWTIQISVNWNNVASVSDSVSTWTWYNYILTRSGNNYTLYKNNTSILTNTTTGVFSQWNFEMSGTVNWVVAFNGKQAFYRMYSRVLTAWELTSVYNWGTPI